MVYEVIAGEGRIKGAVPVMKMPICDNCHHRWSWKQTMKKTISLDPGLTCPYCGEVQYQTQRSKVKGGFLNGILILFPLIINTFIDIPGIYLLSLFPVIFILLMTLYPFTVEISGRGE
jgi:CXXC-20-CXXC protein